MLKSIDSFHQCSNNPALTAIVTKLTQIDALPCAEVQATVGYGVCVFIDAQGTGSVLYEEVKQPCFGKWLWQMVQYFAGYEMASAMFCRECEFYLLYHTVFLNIQYCFEVEYFIVVQK